MSPSSTAAQIFCVFFALFGIPLNVVILNRVGKYMLASMRNLADFLEEKSGRRVSPYQHPALLEAWSSLLTSCSGSLPPALHSPLSPEAQPCLHPPGVPGLRRPALLPGADGSVPAAGGLDLLASHLLLLYYPQHHRLRGLCGRCSSSRLWTKDKTRPD